MPNDPLPQEYPVCSKSHPLISNAPKGPPGNANTATHFADRGQRGDTHTPTTPIAQPTSGGQKDPHVRVRYARRELRNPMPRPLS